MSVFLSVGRHENYDNQEKDILSITKQACVRALFSGLWLKNNISSVDCIYYSPLKRAKETAFIRALGMNLPICVEENALREDALLFEIHNFMESMMLESSEKNLRHVHCVTHQPVISKLNIPYFLAPGEICVFQSNSWEDMFAGKCQDYLYKNNMLTNYPPFVENHEIFLQELSCRDNLSLEEVVNLFSQLTTTE